MSLKPQDVCILLKITALQRAPWSYSQLAFELGMSASEVHAGVKRAIEASLMRLDDGWGYPDPTALEEFLVHGVKYAFAPVRGRLLVGLPTAHAAPPLDRLVAPDDEPPPVWPDPQGPVRGIEFAPLYKSVPQAARRDPRLYELLALVDALRGCERAAREVAVSEVRLRVGAVREADKMTRAPASVARSSKGSTDGKETRVYGRRY